MLQNLPQVFPAPATMGIPLPTLSPPAYLNLKLLSHLLPGFFLRVFLPRSSLTRKDVTSEAEGILGASASKDGMPVATVFQIFWRPSWIRKSRAQTAKHIMVHETHFHFPSISLLHCKAEWTRFPPLDWHTFFRTFPSIYLLYNRETSLTFPAC